MYISASPLYATTLNLPRASACRTSPNVIGPRRNDIAQRGCSKMVFGVECTSRTRNQRCPSRRMSDDNSASVLPTSLALAKLSTTRSRSATRWGP